MTENQPNLVKAVREKDGATIVELVGDIDMHHSPGLHSALVELVLARPKKLVLNLSGVPYMDSSGVGTLVEVFRRVSSYKGIMILCGLTPRVKSVLEITKLDRFFTICQSEEEATQA